MTEPTPGPVPGPAEAAPRPVGEPTVVSALRTLTDDGGHPGFCGPLIELDGLLYGTVVLFGLRPEPGEHGRVVGLEALVGGQWTQLDRQSLGGSVSSEHFAGYGVWKAPAQGTAEDYRLTLRERPRPDTADPGVQGAFDGTDRA